MPERFKRRLERTAFLALWLFLSLACQKGGEAAAPGEQARRVTVEVTPSDLDADALIAKNVQARGGKDKLAAVKALRLTGKLSNTGGEAGSPVVIVKVSPDRYRRDVGSGATSFIQTVDGNTGWQINVREGKKSPVPLDSDDLQRLRRQADVQGPWVDYKAKGHRVEVVGKVKLPSGEAYQLKVVYKTGGVSNAYFDAHTFLTVKTVEPATIQGNQVRIETLYTGYKPVSGTQWPFFESLTIPEAAFSQQMTWSQIEVNPAVDKAQFAMPKAGS